MSLDDIRDAARATVHSGFAIPAVARSHDGLVTIPGLDIRLHRDIRKPFGDLDREGFALMLESHNQVIVDTRQWVPKRNWILDFGRGRVFNIDNVEDVKGERYLRCNVSEYTYPEPETT